MASHTTIGRREFLGTLGGLAGVLPLTGCNLTSMFVSKGPPLPKGPAPDFTKEEIVEHLNDNIHKVRSWRSADVSITARQQGGIPIKLSAFVAVESPRNLRIRAKSMLRGDEADFGSNGDRFWVWFRESPQKVVFTAKHEEVYRVQTRLHLPFDPDWLMEALGVVPIDPSTVSLERNDPHGEVVDLFEERILASGQRVRLATTVDVARGLIVGRTLYDPQGGMVARASITKHRVHDHDEPHGGVVMPHEVKLTWPSVKTTMALSIGRIDVNPSDIEPVTFEVPNIRGCVHRDLLHEIEAAGPPRTSANGSPRHEQLSFTREDSKGFEWED